MGNIRTAEPRDASRIAEIIITNYRGIAFYRRNGFELTGERMIGDDWIPLLKMKKRKCTG